MQWFRIGTYISSNRIHSESLLSLPNRKITWGYIWTVRWLGRRSHFPDGFYGFSGSVRPRIVLKEGNSISTCFPLEPDLFIYLSQQNIEIIFCIDGPAFLKDIKMDNSLPMLLLVFQPRLSFLASLSEGFTSFKHLSSGETCFFKLFFKPLKNFRWLDPFCSKKFDNNVLFHANQHFLFTHLSCRA